MNIICEIFGHKVPRYSGIYGKACLLYVDGIGRGHVEITVECPRCKWLYEAARFHVFGEVKDTMLKGVGK